MKKRLVPTDLAALALGVSTAAVRQMAHRGTLTRYGTKQRAKYDLDELLDLAERRDAPVTCPA